MNQDHSALFEPLAKMVVGLLIADSERAQILQLF